MSGPGKGLTKNLAAFIVAVSLLVTAVAADYYLFLGRIYPGVYFKDYHLGYKNYQEFRLLLEGLQVTFTGAGKTVTYPLKEFGISINEKEVFSRGYNYCRGSRPWNYLRRIEIMRNGVKVPYRYSLDIKALEKGAARVERDFQKKPEDAYFSMNAGLENGREEVRLISETPGRRVNIIKLKNRLLETIKNPENPLAVQVPLEKVPASKTTSYFTEKGIKGLRSSFSTSFDPEVKDRVHNIKLAASFLDGYLVTPGEVFSLNAVLGDTTPGKGCREAPIIIGGELLPGYGGGVCQISSTLYNAALLADLELLERHSHQLTVPYIDPGRDATLSYSTKDLKFRNSEEAYLLIHAAVREDSLTFWLLGKPMGKKVDIVTQVLAENPPPVKYEEDPALAPGEEEIEEGTPGYLVEVWKVVCLDEKEINREKISLDSYEPYPEIIRRAPGDG